MAENSNISWTTHTHNHWVGCTKVSAGCTNCYAESLDKRFGKDRWGIGKPRELTTPANRAKPLKWNKTAAVTGERTLVFSASLSDWLDPEVPAEWLCDLLGLISRTPHLTWQLLTKRPELFWDRMEAVANTTDHIDHDGRKVARDWMRSGQVSNGVVLSHPHNVWLGTTVEDQRRADERIPLLKAIPADVRFLSVEPQLEAIDLNPWFARGPVNDSVPFTGWLDCLCDEIDPDDRPCLVCESRRQLGEWCGIHWIIIGGESGSDARAWNEDWGISLIEQCKKANIAVFMKQTGKTYHNHNSGFLLRARDGKGGDPTFWAPELRVREFPLTLRSAP